MSLRFDEIIKLIERLSEQEREEIWRWLDTRKASNVDSLYLSGETERSAQSLRWLDENREEHLGRWVALEGDRLIASGMTPKEVYSKAKSEGVEVPFVELVTEQEPMPFSSGWLS